MLYDISPSIIERLQVWPGDTPPRREVLLDLARGDNITLSTLHATVHLGAHADAPSHFGRTARTIDQQDLETYLGPCQVVCVEARPHERIASLPVSVVAPRVLIATGTFPDPEHFTEDFAALAPELIGRLHDQGVRLVGIDTPSVDLFDSKDLPTHRACLEYDLAILEGLRLKHVPDGMYELIALPLKLVGFDASPVRAVLRPLAGEVSQYNEVAGSRGSASGQENLA
jgi:arylformamidase